jgi:Na+/H+ antiporter NhaD/arsenite permease-like protein
MISDRRLLVGCLVVLGLVTAGFSLHSALHVQPPRIALLGAGTMIVVSRTMPAQFLEEVE